MKNRRAWRHALGFLMLAAWLLAACVGVAAQETSRDGAKQLPSLTATEQNGKSGTDAKGQTDGKSGNGGTTGATDNRGTGTGTTPPVGTTDKSDADGDKTGQDDKAPQSPDASATEGEKKTGTEPLSPALAILAARTDMAVATLCGNDYYFSEDVFARSLNLSGVSAVTIRSLPAVTDGELMMGSVRVSEGQVIPRSDLRLLSYVAKDSSAKGKAQFTFSPGEVGYASTCNVYLLDELNYSPTVSVVSSEALCVSTHRNFVGYGTLSAYDPEGDPLTFEIVSAPRNGLLLMTDAATGSYVYLPRLGFTGTDSFRYVARDLYGNYSAAATVSVRVEAPSVSVEYADMMGRREYNAALTMTEAGIMRGTALGEKTYFYPDQTVSRVEFLQMAMQTIGVTSLPDVKDTGFADDDAISADAKGYVAAAYRLGYIDADEDSKGNLNFLPDETLTRAQAAVWLCRMIRAEASDIKPVFADAADIPSWADDAIAALSSLGVLTPTAGAGNISPNEPVTRAQTAQMLAVVRRLQK